MEHCSRFSVFSGSFSLLGVIIMTIELSPRRMAKLVETIKRRARLYGAFTAIYVVNGKVENVQVLDITRVPAEGLIGLYSDGVSVAMLREDIDNVCTNC